MGQLDLLVLGGRGLAGSAILQEARARGLSVTDLSREGQVRVDLRDEAALQAALRDLAPRLVINAAAIVSLPACEADPSLAWMVNARPAAALAAYGQETGARWVQISTDHWYTGDGARPHREDEPVRLFNEYARTKYAAEALALTDPGALVVRTNSVGLSSPTGGSFGEWALKLVEEDAPATLFADQFCSSVDVWAFAEALLDLLDAGARGIINLASSQVSSKAEFVQALAHARGRTLTRAVIGSVGGQSVRRGDSLGLDVGRAEGILGRRLPGLDEVVRSLSGRYEEHG